MAVNLAPEWIDSEVTPGLKYQVRSLTGFEQLDVGSLISPTADGTTISGKAARAYLAALMDWEGMIDPQTKQPAPFNAENWRLLSSEEIGEVITAIQTRSNLSADERKN